MKTFFVFAILFSLSIGAIAQSGPIPGFLPGAPGGYAGGGFPRITKPEVMTAHRLEFQVAEQVFL